MRKNSRILRILKFVKCAFSNYAVIARGTGSLGHRISSGHSHMPLQLDSVCNGDRYPKAVSRTQLEHDAPTPHERARNTACIAYPTLLSIDALRTHFSSPNSGMYPRTILQYTLSCRVLYFSMYWFVALRLTMGLGPIIKPKRHDTDLLWICCTTSCRPTTSPQQIRLLEFGFKGWVKRLSHR